MVDGLIGKGEAKLTRLKRKNSNARALRDSRGFPAVELWADGAEAGEARGGLGRHRRERGVVDELREHGQLLVNETQYAKALPLLRRAYDIKPRANLQSYIKRVEGAIDAQL